MNDEQEGGNRDERDGGVTFLLFMVHVSLLFSLLIRFLWEKLGKKESKKNEDTLISNSLHSRCMTCQEKRLL